MKKSVSIEFVLFPLFVGAAVVNAGLVLVGVGSSATGLMLGLKLLALACLLALFLVGVTLRRRNIILMEALDSATAPFVVYDAQDRLIFSNRRYSEALRLSPETMQPGARYEDIVRRTLMLSVPPDRLEFEVARRCALQRAATGQPTDRRYPDGAWFRVTKARTRSGATVGIAIDVTELYDLKARLQAEVERFTALANHAPVGICQLAPDGEVRFLNNALLAMLGVPDRSRLLATRFVFVWGGRRLVGFRSLLAHLSRYGECDSELKLPAENRTFLLKQALVSTPSPDEAVPRETGQVERIFIFVDITERMHAEQRIRYLALHDTLTAAGNRAGFAKAIAQAAEDVTETSPLTLIALDLDRFKPINDTYGHAAGDEVLKQLSARIRGILGPNMSLYRMGGDEFTILCRPDGMTGRASFAEKVLRAIEEPFHLGEHAIEISASVGLSTMPDDTDNAQALLHYADLASYRAKRCGGASVCIFHEGLLDSTEPDRMLEFELKEAIARQSFEVVYQPQFAASGGVPVGVEAFVRWRRKRSGALIRPDGFMSLTHKHHLADELDLMVIDHALADFGRVLDEPRCPHRLAINIAGDTLRRADFPDRVSELLANHRVPGNRLLFEINENDLTRLGDQSSLTIRQLAERGIGFMLDEFGAGATSLRLLAELPLDGIKMDSRLLASAEDPQRAETFVGSVVDLAQRLGIKAVASSIETEEMLEALVGYGFSICQGHLLGEVGPSIPTDLFMAALPTGQSPPFKALPGPETPAEPVA